MPADPATYIALAERLEAGETGPDIDGEIHKATGIARLPPPAEWLPATATLPAPFSTSMDAAMTLVPGGCDWNLVKRGDEFLANVWRDRVVTGHSRAPTPAVALSAAALRAMAEVAG